LSLHLIITSLHYSRSGWSISLDVGNCSKDVPIGNNERRGSVVPKPQEKILESCAVGAKPPVSEKKRARYRAKRRDLFFAFYFARSAQNPVTTIIR